MPPTMPTSVLPSGLSASFIADWARLGWSVEDAVALRMEAEGDGGEGGEGAGSEGGEGEDPPDLGEKGKQALHAERARARDAEKARKAAEKKAADLEARIAQIDDANKSEQEKLLDQARKEASDAAKAEVTAELHAERKEAAIIRAASGKLTDPYDAVVHLVGKVEIGDDGRPDQKAVAKAVDTLLEEKPYLKAGAATAKPGSFDGGARGAAETSSVAAGAQRWRERHQKTST